MQSILHIFEPSVKKRIKFLCTANLWSKAIFWFREFSIIDILTHIFLFSIYKNKIQKKLPVVFKVYGITKQENIHGGIYVYYCSNEGFKTAK